MAYDVNGTIKYYTDLLLYQYNDKPRSRATIDLLAGAAICDLVMLEMQDAFDVETAEGPQLDVIGEYVGFNRIVPIVVPRNYFQLTDYTAPLPSPIGLTDYNDPTLNAGSVFYLYIYQNATFNSLTDEQYRFMIKLKIVLNKLFNSLKNIEDALAQFFGLTVVCFDETNMSMTYFTQGTPPYLLQLAIELNLLPRPIGVRINGIFLVPDVTKIMKMADYAYDTGANIELANYATGFNDKKMLVYSDRVV